MVQVEVDQDYNTGTRLVGPGWIYFKCTPGLHNYFLGQPVMAVPGVLGDLPRKIRLRQFVDLKKIKCKTYNTKQLW